MGSESTPTLIAQNPADLLAGLRGYLPRTRRIRLAAGSLFAEGFVGICAGSGDVPIDVVVRDPTTPNLDTLLTTSTSTRLLQIAMEGANQSRAGRLARASAELRLHFRRSVELLSQNNAYMDSVVTAHARLASGDVRCRVMLNGDIPTKLLLLEGSDVTALSGHDPLSSVFAPASAVAIVESPTMANEFGKWFGALWDSSHDISTLLREELAASWALSACSPYEIYLQMALHYSGADRTEESELAWSHPSFGLLGDFQRDAVRQAVQVIENHNGCFVADVVGLGKSYIGSAILKYFELTVGLRPLVVCPAPLVEMWEEQNERWELGARVVSTGMLSDRSDLAPAFRLENRQLQSREIVLIDESHMFRNSDSQRYELLSHFLSTGRRVVLLTATPMNRTPLDIYHQLKLFHPHDRTRLPISPAILSEYFERIENGAANLQDLLPHVLVRRTRREITRVYGRDADSGERIRPENLDDYASGRRRARFELQGRRFSFPVRSLETVSYSTERTYGRGVYGRLRAMLIPRSTERGTSLCYARYRRIDYVLPEFRSQYRQLSGSAKGLSGLMRSLLFKRLESSTAAFASTVTRMRETVAYLERTLAGAMSGSAPNEDVATDCIAEENANWALAASERTIPLKHLDTLRFLKDLRNDLMVLDLLERTVTSVPPAENAKLLALRTLIESKQLQDRKILIFTEFRETAELVAGHLQRWFPDKQVECCTGAAGNRGRIPIRFSPNSNAPAALRPYERAIDILVSTDVLSEGVNLQDCNTVVNFDLHWNPVRLIQRFGRVDRIGSPHDQIGAFNFLPESELDANLGLRDRLAKRIREIHETIGEDSAILDPSEQINEKAMYAIYEGQTLSDEELSGSVSDSAVQEALGLLASLQEDDPALLDAISTRPLGLRSARASLGSTEVAYTLLRAGSETRFYRCGRYIKAQHVTAESALREVSCLPDELSLPLPIWLGDAVEDSRQAFWADLEERAGDWHAPMRLREGQRQIVDRLSAIAELPTADGKSSERALELQRMLRMDLPDAVVRSLRAIRQRELSNAALLDELSKLCLSHQLHRRQELLERPTLPTVEVIATVAFVVPPERSTS